MTTEMKMNANGISEQEIIYGAKQGDPDCFAFLYNQHKRHVYALCFRITRNTAEAEDLTQEVFMQLFRKVATFRGDAAFSTWLHRVAVNVALMHLRRKSLPIAPEPLESQNADGAKKEFGANDENLAVTIDRIVLERSVDRWLADWAGADAAFLKPVDPFELAQTLLRLAGERAKEAG